MPEYECQHTFVVKENSGIVSLIMNTTLLIEEEERKNRSQAFLWTTVIYVLLFLLLWLVGMWKLTPPPEPMVGIELANLGNGALGSGDIQTHNKPSAIKSRVESKPAKEEAKVEKVRHREEIKEVAPKPTPKAVEAPLKTSKVESPVKVVSKPEPKEVKEEAKVSAPPKAVAKPVEQPKVDSKGLYGKAKSNGTTGTSDEPGGNNNGPAGGKGVGDYGSPDGKVDGKGLYGKGNGGGGGSGGSSLSMTGWTWTRRPSPSGLNSDGKAVIRIKVDENGNLISKTVVEATLSPADVRKLLQEIEKLDFVPTNSSGSRPSSSSGTITFVVRSQ